MPIDFLTKNRSSAMDTMLGRNTRLSTSLITFRDQATDQDDKNSFGA